MADLISNSTGNFTSAGTWSLVDPTSFLNSETNTTNTTTSFVGSSTFTPGAITIDGIAVKVSSHTNPGSGTFSVRLFNTTLASAVVGTTVTINVTDLPVVNSSTNNGWVFMKFAAPVTLLALNAYRVEVTSSSNANVTLYRDATAANFSRMLRTTTTQAPGSGDNTYIMGEYVSAGSNTSFVVTMDNADAGATTFGLTEVSSKGELSWGIAASTNYYYKLAGDILVYTNGTYRIGSLATPIPSTSTAQLEFACSSNVQYGMTARLGGTIKTRGNPLTTNVAMLAADTSVSATSLTTDTSTGWLNGDSIVLSSTTRTKADAEVKTLTANASGTTLTISAITNAHSGTSPIAATLLNLTRNVKIFSTSTTNQTYINSLTSSIVDFQATEFYNMGSATAGKRGIDIGVTTGSATIKDCSIHDFNVASSIGINFNSGANNNIIFSNTVIYNTANIGANRVGTTGTSNSWSNIYVISTGATGINLTDLGGSTTNIYASSATGAGITLSDGASSALGTNSGFTSHSNTTAGISVVNLTGINNNPLPTVSNITTWRNTTAGMTINNVFDVILDTITAFGNTTQNVQFTGSTGRIYIKNLTSNAGTLACPVGIGISSDIKDVYVDNSTFGVTTTHSTGDISVTAANIYPKIYFRNCLFNSTTTLANQGNMIEGGFIASARHNQTNGNHKWYKKYGTIVPDTTIFNKASPSSRLTPSNALYKLQGGIKKIAVPNGQTVTITVFLRKSVAGDGTAYNGNQPRMILLADPAVGVNSDVVLATADNTYNGTFKALTATTPAIVDDAVFQIYIDCDGTSGWINVDDWSANS